MPLNPAHARESPALILMKYLMVGIAATALHYAVLVGVVEGAHLSPAIGAGVGALAGAVLAYVGNHRYTFGARRTAHSQSLGRFMFVALLMALGHAGVVWVGSAMLGLHYLLAQIVASALAFIGGFKLNHSWSFAQAPGEAGAESAHANNQSTEASS